MGLGLDDLADAAGGVLTTVASNAADTVTGVADVAGDVLSAELSLAGDAGRAVAGVAGDLLGDLTGHGDDDERAALAAQQAAAVAAGEAERAQLDSDLATLQTRDGATTAHDLAEVPLFPGPDEDFEQWSHQAIKDLLDGIDVAGVRSAAQEVSTVAGTHRDDVLALQSDLTAIVAGGWQGRAATAASEATATYLGRCAQLAASVDAVGLELARTASVAQQAQQTVGEPEPFDAGRILEAGLDSLPFGGGSLLPDLFDAYQRQEETHQHAVEVATAWRHGYLEVSGSLPVLDAVPSPLVAGAPAPDDPAGRPPEPHPDGPGGTPPPAVVPPGPPAGSVPQSATPLPGGAGSGGGSTPLPGGAGGPGTGGLPPAGPGTGGVPGGGTTIGELPSGHSSGPVGADRHGAGCCCSCCEGGGQLPGAAPAGTHAAGLVGGAPTGLTGASADPAAWGQGVSAAQTRPATTGPSLDALLGAGRPVGSGGAAAAPWPGSGAAGVRAGGFGPRGSASGTFGTPVPSASHASGASATGARPGAGAPGTAAAGSATVTARGGAVPGADGADGGRPVMGGMPMMGGAGGRGKDGGEHRRPDYLVGPQHAAELVGDLPLVAPPVIGGR